MLHGYGGDGKDISMLALNWKRHLPNTIFICPNGHERCHINPSGYQWFDLSNEDPKYILAQSQRAEKKLSQFIDEVKKEYNIDNDKIIDRIEPSTLDAFNNNPYTKPLDSFVFN